MTQAVQRYGNVSTPKFFALLRELDAMLLRRGLTGDKVVLVGSAPLAAAGLRDVHDLDVLASPLLLDPSSSTSDEFACIETIAGRMEFSASFSHFFARTQVTPAIIHVLANTFKHDGREWRVLDLQTLLSIKETATREKDLADARLLREALRRGPLAAPDATAPTSSAQRHEEEPR